MWPATLSDRDRRALAIGGGVLLLALAWIFVIRPSLARTALLRDQWQVETTLVERERALVAAAVDATVVDSTADYRVFAGTDDIIATSNLAAYLTAAAEEREVWVQSVTTRAATDGPAGLRTLHADLRAEGDVEGLLRFLDALESGAPYVRLETLEVSAAAGTDDGTAPVAFNATILAYATAASERASAPSVSSVASISSRGIEPLVARTIARDPFSPERRAPDVRYRLRNADAPGAPLAAEDRAPQGPTATWPEVRGTAVDGSGRGFAMVTLDGGPVVVLRTGDTLGQYTVLSIERARVSFRDASGQRQTIDATVSPDGAVP